MFTKIVRLILLRDLMRQTSFPRMDLLVPHAEQAARFVLKGEVPERPAPRPDAG